MLLQSMEKLLPIRPYLILFYIPFAILSLFRIYAHKKSPFLGTGLLIGFSSTIFRTNGSAYRRIR